MAAFGFISGKLEIKFLILYIASRVVEPVPFETLQEVAMCDGGVDYFGFSECLASRKRFCSSSAMSCRVTSSRRFISSSSSSLRDRETSYPPFSRGRARTPPGRCHLPG